VILAVPGCGVGGDNLNKIRGSYESKFTQEQNRALTSVQHDARWSFAFYLPSESATKCDLFFGDDAVEKVVDDSTVHLLCYQSRKAMKLSGVPPEGGVAVVAHSTNEWARRNAQKGGRDQRLLAEMAEKIAQILQLGNLARTMLGSKVITWKQSQVTKALTGSSQAPCMMTSSGPALALAGDYFTDSSFGGCLKSGFAAADGIAKLLGGGGAGSNANSQQQVASNDASKVESASGKGGKDRGKRWHSESQSSWAESGQGKKGKGKESQSGKGKGKSGGKKGYWEERSW
jgi:hypothetical protein